MKKINSKEEQERVRNEVYDFLKEELSYLPLIIEKKDLSNWLQVIIRTDHRFLNSTWFRCFLKVYNKYKEDRDYSDDEVDFYIDTREVKNEHGICTVVVIEVDVKMSENK